MFAISRRTIVPAFALLTMAGLAPAVAPGLSARPSVVERPVVSDRWSPPPSEGHSVTRATTRAIVAPRPPANSSAVLARPSLDGSTGPDMAGDTTPHAPPPSGTVPADVRPRHGPARDTEAQHEVIGQSRPPVPTKSA